MAFRPYLFFPGTCRAAFTRYHEIFGGDLALMTMADVPGETPSPEQADIVIHASVTVGDDVLMGSDDPMSSDGGRPVLGMMISYDASDDADARRVLDALAEGGSVEQDLIPTFFSSAFGLCTDRFGIPWMVVAPDPGSAA
jgi:PhnB protein